MKRSTEKRCLTGLGLYYYHVVSIAVNNLVQISLIERDLAGILFNIIHSN